MDFAGSTRADENRTRLKGVVVKSFVVPQRPSKVMGYTKLESHRRCCLFRHYTYKKTLYLQKTCAASE